MNLWNEYELAETGKPEELLTKFLDRFIEIYCEWEPHDSAGPLSGNNETLDQLSTHLSHKIPENTKNTPGHPMRLIKALYNVMSESIFSATGSDDETITKFITITQILSRSKHNRILLNTTGFIPSYSSLFNTQVAKLEEFLTSPQINNSSWRNNVISFLDEISLSIIVIRNFNGIDFDWLNSNSTAKQFIMNTLDISLESAEIGCEILSIDCLKDLLSIVNTSINFLKSIITVDDSECKMIIEDGEEVFNKVFSTLTNAMVAVGNYVQINDNPELQNIINENKFIDTLLHIIEKPLLYIYLIF